MARDDVARVFGSVRGLVWSAVIFSCAVNILMLTGPLFMLQVYDRVLASGSEATLLALVILIAGLFAAMGLLDFVRGRILARAGARIQTRLDPRVFSASLQRALSPRERTQPNVALRDLESIQQFLSSSGPFAFFDVPWVPVYLAAIFVLHWMLGVFATGAAVIVCAIALVNAWRTGGLEAEARRATAVSEKRSESLRGEAETLRALGMGKRVLAGWQQERKAGLTAQITYSDRAGGYQALTKTLRMFLQSAVLGLGAWLAIRGETTAGAMIAASILMGRALAPIDQIIGHWKGFTRARAAKNNLRAMLKATPEPAPKMALPQARGHLTLDAVSATAPGLRVPLLRSITLSVAPGEALGIIGASASGKSTLARVIAGIWPPIGGDVCLDGARLDQLDAEVLGAQIGYLPQDIGLFSGTVGDNIARFDPDADPNDIVKAATRSGAHAMILALPNGYATEIGEGGAALSGGQRQRIGLARALYGDPVLLVLDEPNAHLDAPGEQAVISAIENAKENGCSVIVMAHRPSAIALCDRLMVLKDGQTSDYGPRDEVLQRATRPRMKVVPGDRP